MKRLRVFIYISLMTFFIVGCQNEGTSENEITNQNPIQVKQSYDNEKKDMSSTEISAHLVDLAKRVAQVEGATAVVAGGYAVVGIDVNDDLDRTKVSSIKYSVAEALRHDPYGAKAVVTADPDIVERLKHMADQIKKGNPVTGILDELAAIVGRIMPEVPSEIEDKGEAPTEQNKEELPNNQENKLNKEQRDQSKSEKGEPTKLNKEQQ